MFEICIVSSTDLYGLKELLEFFMIPPQRNDQLNFCHFQTFQNSNTASVMKKMYRPRRKRMRILMYLLAYVGCFSLLWTVVHITSQISCWEYHENGHADQLVLFGPIVKRLQPPRKMPTTRENRRHDQPTELEIASTFDFSWKILSKNWKLFSSYIDDRPIKCRHGVFEKSLITMGYEKGPATNELKCVVIWGNNTRTSLPDNAVRIMLSEQWKVRLNSFRSYFYRCRLPLTNTPRYITLISKNSTNVDTIPLSSFVPVVDPKSTVLHDFGVCIETPLFGNGYEQIIIDSIEMNRLLGAEWFTVYVHDAHQDALDILQAYSKQGILEAVYNWGENIASPIYMKGVIVGINDCLYRNMYKVRYLAYCDFDEVIVPKMHLDWPDLITAVERHDRAFFTFRHVAFHRNLSQKTEYLQCPGNTNRKYRMPQYLATRNRSVNVFPLGLQAKSITKPIHCLYVQVHTPGELVRGYRQFQVPPEVALLQHFRNEDDPRYKKYNSTTDHSMDRFNWALLTAVKNRICRKGSSE